MEEYRIIECVSRVDLEIKVNKYLKEGWVCQGGILYIKDSYGDSYIQAIILKSIVIGK